MDRESLNDYPQLGKYDVTVEISDFEQDRLISWTVLGQLRPQIGHVYGCRLEPSEGTLGHRGYVVLRLVEHRPEVARRRYFSGDFRGARCGRRWAFSTAPCAGGTHGAEPSASGDTLRTRRHRRSARGAGSDQHRVGEPPQDLPQLLTDLIRQRTGATAECGAAIGAEDHVGANTLGRLGIERGEFGDVTDGADGRSAFAVPARWP